MTWGRRLLAWCLGVGIATIFASWDTVATEGTSVARPGMVSIVSAAGTRSTVLGVDAAVLSLPAGPAAIWWRGADGRRAWLVVDGVVSEAIGSDPVQVTLGSVDLAVLELPLAVEPQAAWESLARWQREGGDEPSGRIVSLEGL